MIAPNNHNKNLKYNHVIPINLDTIPQCELEQALKEFAEGSLNLEICLKTMWENGLKTHACCSGNHSENGIGYIAMAPGINVFNYLSNEILDTDIITLEFTGNKQIIRFGGSKDDKEYLLQKIALDISTGKKNNIELIRKKLYKHNNIENKTLNLHI
jgi:hypothetical protein